MGEADEIGVDLADASDSRVLLGWDAVHLAGFLVPIQNATH